MPADNKTRKPRARPMGKVNKATKKYVKKQLRSNSELKDIKTEINEAQINSVSGYGPTFYDLGIVQQGLGNGQRIGNQIKLTGFQFKGVFNNNGSNTNFIRVVLLWENRNTAAAGYTPNSVIFDRNTGVGAGTGTTTTGLATMYFPIMKGDFSVLYDKVYKVGPAGSATGSTARFFNIFKKLNTKITYSALAATPNVYDQPDKRLQLMFFASEGPNDVTTGQVVEVDALTRVWYADN